MDVDQVVKRFKIDLIKKLPFYGDIVTHLVFEPNYTINTACTDGRKVQYNPEFLSNLNAGEINFILMHEIFHVLLMHTSRMGGRNHKVWNIACDLVVNSMLIYNLSKNINNAKIPFEKPDFLLYSYISNEETVEDIYEKQMAVNNTFNLMTPSKVKVVFNDGYGWDTIKETDAPDDLIISKNIYKEDSQRSYSDSTDTEQYIKNIIKEALHKSRRTIGSVYIPGEIYSFTNSKKLDWKKLLKDYLTEKISDDTSYTTPERKYIHMDLILPGHCLCETEIEEIWAFVDSSGSVSHNETEQFLTQLYRIVKEFKCTLNLCYWDTSVTDIYKNIRNEKDVLKSIPYHSGGTDINCVYDWIRENRVKPDVMVILSDGYFGSVSDENKSLNLKRKTVLVLSSKQLAENDDMKQIGRVAEL